MPYSRNCGAKSGENARYCPSCGTPVTGPATRILREEGRPGIARFALLVFGGIILLAGFGLLAGGGALIWVNTTLTDTEGFLSTQNRQLETDSYAIVFKHANIYFGEEWWWRPSARDLATVKLTGRNNNPSKEIFIGIAEQSKVETYLSDVWYVEATRFGMSGSPLQGFTFSVDYAAHPGESLSEAPTSQTFWTASKHGTGTQTLDWEPQTGNYWIVLMNEDGSAGVDLTMKIGVRVPILTTIAIALLSGGVLALIAGGTMIYLGFRR